MSIQRITLSLVLCSFLLSGCVKEEVTPTPLPTPNVIPRAAYLGVHKQTVHDQTLSTSYSASAIFLYGIAPVPAGIVSVNGLELLFDGLTYYTAPALPVELITGTGGWEITGANGIEPFDHAYQIDIPYTTGFSAGTIDKSQPYTLSIDPIYNEDSTTFSIGYNIQHTVVASTSSYTFTPEEMSALPTGTTTVAIQVSSSELRTVGNMNVQYSMTSGHSKTVTVLE